MNPNDDVVYRCLRLGPLHELHPSRSGTLVCHHDRLHRPAPCVCYIVIFRIPFQTTENTTAKTRCDVVIGFVPLLDMPFKLAVPLSVKGEDDKENDAVWMCLPSSVLPQENPIDWLTNAPNLKYLTVSQKRKLAKTVSSVGEALRSIRLNLMTTSYPDEQSGKLGQTIIPHFERGANDLVLDLKGRGSLSIWEFHLAAEKAIKLYLRQRGIQPPKIHDLRKLHSICVSEGDGVASRRLLSKLPEAKTIIQHRYGEVGSPDLQSGFEAYVASLQVVRAFTKKLTRKLTMDNASFLIRKPPWMYDAVSLAD